MNISLHSEVYILSIPPTSKLKRLGDDVADVVVKREQEDYIGRIEGIMMPL